MTKAVTRRTPTQKQRAKRNPFASTYVRTRTAATQRMLDKREAEVCALREALLTATGPQKRILTTRLRATLNNIAAWDSYAETVEREPRAVIVP